MVIEIVQSKVVEWINFNVTLLRTGIRRIVNHL
jgi:hypothetical protein